MAQCYKARRVRGRAETVVVVIEDGELYPFAPGEVAYCIGRNPAFYHGYRLGRGVAPLASAPFEWYTLETLLWDDDPLSKSEGQRNETVQSTVSGGRPAYPRDDI